MAAIEPLVAGAGLVVVSAAFFRLAASDVTDRLVLPVIEYGVALAALVAGVGFVAVTLVG